MDSLVQSSSVVPLQLMLAVTWGVRGLTHLAVSVVCPSLLCAPPTAVVVQVGVLLQGAARWLDGKLIWVMNVLLQRS
jgi:hypothetical protein